jgi:hypothetical protein
MSSAASYSSTASLVSKNSASAKPGSPKNYEAAFANLVSSFGFGGGVPITSQKVAKMPKSHQTPVTSPATHVTRSHTAPKNYEAAFGSLSSSYGFGGGVPCLVPKAKA